MTHARWRFGAVGLLFALLSVSCGGSSSALGGRFIAVHNAMSAMGLSQTVPISQGSLPQGADARIDVRLVGGQCYTFMAFGSDQVRDIDLRVVDEGGTELGRDVTHDREAAAQVCPDDSGAYQAIVTMKAGQGTFTVTGWGGGSRPGTAAGFATHTIHGGSVGTCDNPLPLEIGRPVHGNTQTGSSNLEGSCVGGNSPEQVYRLAVSQRGQLSVRLDSTYDGALYLLQTCDQGGHELACNDDATSNDRTHSALDVTVDPGTYFIVVDGYQGASGEYDLIASVAPLQPVAAVCGAAPPIIPGQPVSGTTQGAANYFQATCANGAGSGDRVYRLDVQSRSRLRLLQESDHDGALYVRRNCQDAASEIACNDDWKDQRHSLVMATVDPGTYYVYSDGFGQNAGGHFTLTADLAPATGGGATSDTCSDATAVTPGQAFAADTFTARDDMTGELRGSGGAGPRLSHRRTTPLPSRGDADRQPVLGRPVPASVLRRRLFRGELRHV